MAKGQSTFRQLGKIDGRKYYHVKGVDGIVSQSINQGMSNRVKNDAAYANTRLNNAEFGGAGSTAGAITRALSQKWRYLLVPFATGKIAKDVRNIMMFDASAAWGQRGLVGTTWQAALAEKVSGYSKNISNDFSGISYTAVFNSNSGMAIGFDAENFACERLQSLGCDGVKIICLAQTLDTAAYDSNVGKYAPAMLTTHAVATADVDFGDTTDVSAIASDVKVTAQASGKLYHGIFVFLPYRMVNSVQYIMQEHCAFKMVAPTGVE